MPASCVAAELRLEQDAIAAKRSASPHYIVYGEQRCQGFERRTRERTLLRLALCFTSDLRGGFCPRVSFSH